MPDPERNVVIYVTADSSEWFRMDFPFGLITPPIIELHRPLAGAVRFYYAECYGLPVPEEVNRGDEQD